EFEIDPADTVVRIRDLIDRGILFQHHTNPTISFRRFPSKQSNPGRCVYCGRNSNRITKDHVIPRSQGGSDQASNIVQACPSCNQAKGNRTPQQWAADILKFRQPAKVTPLRWLDRIRLMALVVRNFVQRGESC
ncbi:MAG: HNH endonuclease, partial [Planctomycetota bacterium]